MAAGEIPPQYSKKTNMGSINYFNLQGIKDRYKLDVFFETGLGYGTSLRYAQNFDFKKLFSTEIIVAQAEKLIPEFSEDSRVEILIGDSPVSLEATIPKIEGMNCLWFLDSHLPGGDCGYNAYDAEQNLDIRLPLERELDIIYRTRVGTHRDVIICDDLRLYEDAPYEGGNLNEMGLGHLTKYGTEFLKKFEKSHVITKLYCDTGYIVMEPRDE